MDHKPTKNREHDTGIISKTLAKDKSPASSYDKTLKHKPKADGGKIKDSSTQHAIKPHNPKAEQSNSNKPHDKTTAVNSHHVTHQDKSSHPGTSKSRIHHLNESSKTQTHQFTDSAKHQGSCLCPTARRKSLEYSHKSHLDREDTELDLIPDNHHTDDHRKHDYNGHHQRQNKVGRSFSHDDRRHLGRDIHVEDWATPRWHLDPFRHTDDTHFDNTDAHALSTVPDDINDFDNGPLAKLDLDHHEDKSKVDDKAPVTPDNSFSNSNGADKGILQAIESEYEDNGTISQDTRQTYQVRTCYMHVDHSAEKRESWITGFAILSRDLIVVSDYNNNRVKIIDVEESFVLSRMVLTTSPKDLTLVSPDFVAVTLPALDTVQFLSIKGQPPMLDVSDKSFKVNGYCNGIAYNDNQLFVTFISPAKIEILTLQGEVIHTLSTDQHSAPMFKSPQYIAVYFSSVFVTDNHSNSVLKISQDGHVIATYQHEALKNPQGITITNDGTVLVCSQDSHVIHSMTSACNQLSICLEKDDGIWWPHVIGHCRDRNALYISSTSGDPDIDNYLRMYTFEDTSSLSMRLLQWDLIL